MRRFLWQKLVAEFFIIGESFVVITSLLQEGEVLSKLSTMNDKSSFVNVPLVITKQLVTKQLKLYFNHSSRIPTLVWAIQLRAGILEHLWGPLTTPHFQDVNLC
jgi:hypothetical protein